MTPLKNARLATGLTAIELAKIAGTTENRLFQLERGRFRPRALEAAGLSLALDIPIDELFPGGTQNPNATGGTR